MNYIAKGASGGRSSGGSRSTPKTSTPKPSTSAPKPAPAPKSTTPKTSTKAGTSKSAPGTKIKTVDGKEVQSSAKKPTNSKYTRSTGIVGDSGYQPKFKNYSAPAGSVVYYPQHSAMDYMFWMYIFSHNHSPRYDQATVVQPDNKEVTVPPEKGGIDGLLILNWIIMIAIILAVVAGIIWLVNKLTRKGGKSQ